MSTTTATEPHLTDGWEPDAPVGDTMLRRYVWSWASLCESLATARGGRATWGPEYAAADSRRPSGWYNGATLLRPLAPDALDDTLGAVEAFLDGGTGQAVLWSPWPTPDLRARGWHLEGHPPVLLRPPANTTPTPRSPDVELTLVDDATGLATWERVAIEGYPFPELADAGPGELADPRLLDDERFRFTVGWEDGTPVSIGALFTDHGVGCFALGVTLPEIRGRGHWRAHAVDRLTAEPDLWSAGIFSDHSRPPAERLGFVPVLRTTMWTRPRP